jgi:hypothetical protein
MTERHFDADIYHVLSCERRRLALEFLYDAGPKTTLTELADAVAAVETGEVPAPRAQRESVYTSLRQTHVPTLERYGLVERDGDGFRTTPAAKPMVRHLRGAGPLGVAWSELYRGLGIGGLCGVVGTLAGIPGIDGVNPVLPAVLALGAYAGFSAYHAWTLRPRRVAAASVTSTDGRWQPADA